MQLQRLPENNAKRRSLTLLYREKLCDLAQIEIPFVSASEGPTDHIFPILLKDKAARPDFMAALARQGIQTSIHYPQVHAFSHYRQLCPPHFDHRLPLAEEVALREVTLPLFPGMSQAQLEEVAMAVKTFFAICS